MDGEPKTASEAATTCVVDEEWLGRVAVVSASGVMDMLTAPQVEQHLRAVIDKQPAALLIDLTNVEFLASAGMRVLVETHDTVASAMPFGVVANGPATSRPLELVGITELIKLYPTREEALSALNA